jgi:hypothetical protein
VAHRAVHLGAQIAVSLSTDYGTRLGAAGGAAAVRCGACGFPTLTRDALGAINPSSNA